jgi:acetaldehyde dehydrogenase (acetylating)
MTLGCGAAGGNSTGDNVGPLHLINIKRLAYWVRRPEDAYQVPAAGTPQSVPLERQLIASAVERYLAERGVPPGAGAAPARPSAAGSAAGVVDQFLAGKRGARTTGIARQPPCECPPQPGALAQPAAAAEIKIVDFVCEADVREALAASRKIYIGPRTIVTPAARDLADQHGILVVAQRQ